MISQLERAQRLQMGPAMGQSSEDISAKDELLPGLSPDTLITACLEAGLLDESDEAVAKAVSLVRKQMKLFSDGGGMAMPARVSEGVQEWLRAFWFGNGLDVQKVVNHKAEGYELPKLCVCGCCGLISTVQEASEPRNSTKTNLKPIVNDQYGTICFQCVRLPR